jgi:hypothetical protein
VAFDKALEVNEPSTTPKYLKVSINWNRRLCLIKLSCYLCPLHLKLKISTKILPFIGFLKNQGLTRRLLIEVKGRPLP